MKKIIYKMSTIVEQNTAEIFISEDKKNTTFIVISVIFWYLFYYAPVYCIGLHKTFHVLHFKLWSLLTPTIVILRSYEGRIQDF